MRSGLLFSALSVISWSVSLLVISLCIWIVSSGVRRSMKDNVTARSLFPGMPKVRPRGEITIWIGSMLAMLAIGLAVGYGARDRQLLASTVTYSDVYVRQKISDQRFLMQPRWMTAIDSELCPKSLVDWRQGETIQDWTFEQQRGCKRVISYHRYQKGELNVSVTAK